MFGEGLWRCALLGEVFLSSHYFLVLMALVGVTAILIVQLKTFVSLESTRHNVLIP